MAIVDIWSVASLDTRGDGAVSVMGAVLVDGVGADFLIMAAVLVGGRSAELLVVAFTACAPTIDRASCSAVPMVSPVDTALVVDLVGAGSLDVRSSLLAA